MRHPWTGMAPVRPEPVVLDVPCIIVSGTQAEDLHAFESAVWHRITLRPDWTATIPHDIEAERVAASLGAGLSCLRFLDRVLPALRTVVQVAERKVWPVEVDETTLRNTGPDRRVVRYLGPEDWPLGPLASVRRRASATRGHLDRMLIDDLPPVDRVLLVEALDQLGISIAVSDHIPLELADPARVRLTDGAGETAWILWDLGFCPEAVEAAHEALAVDGGHLPLTLYAALAERKHDLDALAALRHHGADTLTALVNSGLGAPRLEQVAVLDELLTGGVRPIDLARLLRVGADPRRLLDDAVRLGEWSLPEAARLLTGWADAECAPTWHHLRVLTQVGANPFDVPPPLAVSEVAATLGVSRTEAGLLIVLTDPPRTAADEVRGFPDLQANLYSLGVVTFEDAVALLHPHHADLLHQPTLGDPL